MLGLFKSQGVNAVDLNLAVIGNNCRTSYTHFFSLQDSHWTAAGAKVAVDAIKKRLISELRFAKVHSSTPRAGYGLKIVSKKRASRGSDLADHQLPPNTSAIESAQVTHVNVMCSKADQMKRGTKWVSKVPSLHMRTP